MEQKWSSSRTKPRKWPVCTSNKYTETSQGMAWTCRVHWPIATRLERNTLIKNTDLCQAGWRWWENLQSGAGWKDRKHKDCVSNATDILSPEESHLSCSTHSHYVPHSIPQKKQKTNGMQNTLLLWRGTDRILLLILLFFFFLGWPSSKKLNAASFQIGLGWNLEGVFFK